jgi:hypothetical protein
VNELDSHSEFDQNGFRRFPPYIRTEADHERWALCEGIAKRQAELFSDDAELQFIWLTTRTLFRSSIPTGRQEDQDRAIALAAAFSELPVEKPFGPSDEF